MPAPDPLFHKGHRQRLAAKIMARKATEYELLEYWLTQAVPRRDMRPLSRLLIKTFGGYSQVITASRERLLEVKGVGPKVVEILEALRQSSEIDCRERLESQSIYRSPVELANYCKSQVCGKPVEEFHAMYLDKDHRLIVDDTHTYGGVDRATVYPREILRRALHLNAVYVCIYHNHPRETGRFSPDDIKCTEEIIKRLSREDIILYDHYLIAGATVHSMLEEGHLRDLNKN